LQIQYWLFGLVESTFLRFYGRILRISRLGGDNLADAKEASGATLFALWHSRMMVPLYEHRDQGRQVLVTHERHGQYISETLRRMGFGAVRGKSSWMDGLREMVHKARDGYDLGVTPDGPHGPPEVAQAGIIFLSQKTGVPILPTAVSYTHCIRLPTWDGYRLPLPFTNVLISYGEPLYVPAHCNSAKREEIRQELQKRMEDLYEKSDRLVRLSPSSMLTATSPQSGKKGQRTHSLQTL